MKQERGQQSDKALTGKNMRATTTRSSGRNQRKSLTATRRGSNATGKTATSTSSAPAKSNATASKKLRGAIATREHTRFNYGQTLSYWYNAKGHFCFIVDGSSEVQVFRYLEPAFIRKEGDSYVNGVTLPMEYKKI